MCAFLLSKYLFLILFKYVGQWHEVQRSNNSFQTGNCPTVLYTAINATLYINNTEYVNGSNTINQVTASIKNSTVGKFLANYTAINASQIIPYWILATDYDNYAVVWACQNSNENSSTRKYSIGCFHRQHQYFVV